MPTNPRTVAVQGRRRSNAAGPHGTGRRPALDTDQAISEALDTLRVFNESPLGRSIRQAAENVHAAGNDDASPGGPDPSL